MSNKRVEAGASAGEQWLSAREVLDVIRRRVPYGHANETVCLLAREGILRARAGRFRSGGHECGMSI